MQQIKPITLTELLSSLTEVSRLNTFDDSLLITGIACDSREVIDGNLFVAIAGHSEDGTVYIRDAIKRGAAAVLCATDKASLPDELTNEVAVLSCAEPRKALSQLAAYFYQPQPEFCVAITGTDGKTSVADFCRQLWTLQKKRGASIGTLGVICGDEVQVLANTTPDAVTLHRSLATLKQQGCEHVAMEISSIAIDQYRAHGVNLKAACCTNITRDHLDYHLTEEAYKAAKLRLFSEILPEGAAAVLNSDDSAFPDLMKVAKARGQQIIDFGLQASALRLIETYPHGRGTDFAFSYQGKTHHVSLPLAGRFQVYNVLAALGLLSAEGVNVDNVIHLLPKLCGVRGRLEHVGMTPSGGDIYVDYAHTPNALKTVLEALRPHTHASLRLVFGCGGDRDSGKRKPMGKVAEEFADIAIITDDNPRTENAEAIRAEVQAGCPSGQVIGDRHTAIFAAVNSLQKGDVLLIAGKGHEDYQIIGTKTYPFDDAAVARNAIAQLEQRNEKTA